MHKRTKSELMRDFSNQFLNEIVKRKKWTDEEVINEFHRSMYILAVEYFDEKDN